MSDFQSVLDFWFEELERKMWWQKSAELDGLIAERFGALHARAACGELFSWRRDADGALAEVILLDQFSRNIYRDQPGAFAFDGLALALAQGAVEKGFDQLVPVGRRSFFYMPYMHSESALIHEEAVGLFEKHGNENSLDFELKHKKIIDRFGRYPHRNEILGRESTDEEIAFLNEPGSSF